MVRFFARCRAGENGTWQDSLYNVGGGCKTERDAEVLLVKLENIPANYDLEYSVVGRVVVGMRWFLAYWHVLDGTWSYSLTNPPYGFSTKAEAEKEARFLALDESEYRSFEREANDEN